MAGRTRKSMGERIDAGEQPKASEEGSNPFTATTVPEASGPVQTIRLDLIDADEENLRTEVGDVTELAQSISELGVIQPVIVRPTKDGHYLLVAGHRRRAGAIAAGLTEVPAVIRENVDDTARDLMMLVENLQREDLTPLEEARGYQRVLARQGIGGQSGLAKKIGRSQGHISKRVALLKLPEEVLADIEAGKLTVSDAGELVQLAAYPERIAAVLEAVRSNPGWRNVATEARSALRAIEEESRIAGEVANLTAAGVPEVTGPNNMAHGPWPIAWMDLTEEEKERHGELPCHAWRLDRRHLDLLCTAPGTHRSGRSEEGSDSTSERAEGEPYQDDWERTRAEQRAAREAEEARRLANAERRAAFAAELVAKSKDYGPGFVARMWMLSSGSMDEAPTPSLVARLLGRDDTTAAGVQFTDEAIEALFSVDSGRYAQRVLYAIALAAGDLAFSGRFDCDEAFATARLYLDHLRQAGYALSEDDAAIEATMIDYEQERADA